MREAGVNVIYRNVIDDVQIGDTLLVNSKNTMDVIDTKYTYDVLLSEYDQRVVVIKAYKKPN
jgi:hypothetical protein